MIPWFLKLIAALIVIVLGCLGVWWVLGQTGLPHNVKLLIVALVACVALYFGWGYLGLGRIEGPL